MSTHYVLVPSEGAAECHRIAAGAEASRFRMRTAGLTVTAYRYLPGACFFCDRGAPQGEGVVSKPIKDEPVAQDALFGF